MLERNDLMRQRQAKADRLAAANGTAWPNDFQPSHTGAEMIATLGAQLEPVSPERGSGPAMRLAGRLIGFNRKGKVAFLRLRDRSAGDVIAERKRSDDARFAAGMERRDSDASTFQVFFSREEAPEVFDALCKSQAVDGAELPPLLDVGDIVGAVGRPFRTRTGEPSLWACTTDADGEPLQGETKDSPCLRILAKAVRPLPDKWHGLTDKETRFRQRYVDLAVNDDVREVFVRRARLVAGLRRFFDGRGYLEVETPMMHPLVGGAAARPFTTHHNALDMPLYMRIAPELYLKRLVVGGLERVYEINRNFRNEGLSQQHNPEFTMLEFYQAYATYTDLMDLIEQLFTELTVAVCGSSEVPYGLDDAGEPRLISMAAPFDRVSVHEGLARWGRLSAAEIADADVLRARLAAADMSQSADTPLGKLQMELFEHVAEPHLIQPTFVTDFPVEVSPLSRRKDDNPALVDRFELYVAGFEVANAFSELNDPVDQHERFAAQVQQKAGGDAEAMDMDLDYIRALEYGMPPTAGCGIGVDRLAMVLSNTASIREVILFPLLRPERPAAPTDDPDAGSTD